MLKVIAMAPGYINSPIIDVLFIVVNPQLSQVSPARVPITGSAHVTMNLEYTPIVAFASDVAVSFGTDATECFDDNSGTNCGYVNSIEKINCGSNYCQALRIVVTTPSMATAGTVAVNAATRQCADCESTRIRSAVSLDYELPVPSVEPGFPSPASGSVLGSYFIAVNVRYLIMGTVMPSHFVADFMQGDTAVASHHTTGPSLSATNSLVTRFDLQMPAGSLGTTTISIRLADVNTSLVSFNFTYLADMTPRITFLNPQELFALGGVSVQILTSHVPDLAQGDLVNVTFDDLGLVGIVSSSVGASNTIQFVAPFLNLDSTHTAWNIPIQLSTHAAETLSSEIQILSLPAVDHVECGSTASCTGQIGESMTLHAWLSNIPQECSYRPGGCNSEETPYLPDCDGACSDVVAQFGSHGAGSVTKITRVGTQTRLRLQSPIFVQLGVLSVSLVLYGNTQFPLGFDLPVQEVVSGPILVGDYDELYMPYIGGEKIHIQVNNLQVSEANELQVTYDGISTTVAHFSMAPLGSDLSQISFTISSLALAPSRLRSRAQVVVKNINSDLLLSVSFSVHITESEPVQFNSVSPASMILNSYSEPYLLTIQLSNVHQASSISVVNFTNPLSGIAMPASILQVQHTQTLTTASAQHSKTALLD